MKFTDGNWMIRDGYEVHFPRTVIDDTKTKNGITLFAPCKDINHRGDTLDGPLLTIHLSAPQKDIIRVQTWHFKGGKEKYPQFVLGQENTTVEMQNNEDKIQFTSGSLKLEVDKHNFAMAFYNESTKLTEVESKGLAWIDGPEDNTYMRGQLNMSVGENIYGLGERFTPFVKNGQTLDTWNKDGGTSSEQSYKNVPFYMSSKGYGVFVNHSEEVSFELGSEVVSKAQFSVEGECLDYFIINGPTPKDVLRNYTQMTGKPALPPAWSFGLWLSTSFTTDYNEETVIHFVDGMAERGIPLSVFHFDCFWMKEFEWNNFIWDRRNFPDPENMLRRLKDKGLKICVWINPYIAQKSPLFEEGMENGYLLKKPNGDVWQWDLWQAGMGIVDFSNPEACNWYKNKLKVLLDMGVDSFKTDFGERIPTDVIYHDGSDPYKMHNFYAYIYNEAVFELLKEEKGEKEAIVFARSATAGSQKFPVHWGGDCDSTYEAMAESLRGGLSLTMSGFGYWSHDIGGFENTATPDVFKRWTAFGLLSSHSRFHGSSSYRVPWNFDEEAVAVAEKFTKLKNSLMPYLYSAAVENSKTGIPVMRAMHLEFPEDPTCDFLDRQYMLGDSILVAPIFSEDGKVTYYLPEGTWIHLLTGKELLGGNWRKETYDYMSLPLFVKENTILPVGDNEQTPVYDYEENVVFHFYKLKEGQKVVQKIYNVSGEVAAELTVVTTAKQIKVNTNLLTNYSLLLHGSSKIQSVTNAHWEETNDGVKIIPQRDYNDLIINL